MITVSNMISQAPIDFVVQLRHLRLWLKTQTHKKADILKNKYYLLMNCVNVTNIFHSPMKDIPDHYIAHGKQKKVEHSRNDQRHCIHQLVVKGGSLFCWHIWYGNKLISTHLWNFRHVFYILYTLVWGVLRPSILGSIHVPLYFLRGSFIYV